MSLIILNLEQPHIFIARSTCTELSAYHRLKIVVAVFNNSARSSLHVYESVGSNNTIHILNSVQLRGVVGDL